jgi:site-specific DNA recombinase
MKRYVGYLRQSHQERDRESMSIPDQKRRITNYVKAVDGVLVGWYIDEDISAVNYKKREAYKKLKDDLDKNIFDIIVFLNYSRLSRDLRDFMEFDNMLQEYGIDLVSIEESFDTSTPVGRALRDTWVRFKQAEREQLSVTIKNIRQTMKERGKYAGGPLPWGLSWDKEKKEIIKDEEKLRWYGKMSEMAKDGMSLWEIAKDLNDSNMRTQTGKKFTDVGVQRLLTNKNYATYGAISENEFLDLQEKRRANQPKRKWNFLLSGLIYCECGSPAIGKRNWDFKGKEKRKVYKFQYICRKYQSWYHRRKGETVCTGSRRLIKMEKADRIVLDSVKKFFQKTPTRIVEDFNKYYDSIINEEMIIEQSQKLNDLRLREERLLTAIERGVIKPEQARNRNNKIQKQKEMIEVRLKALKQIERIPDEQILEVAENIADIEKLPILEQKRVLRSLVKKVTFSKKILKIDYVFSAPLEFPI